MMRPILFSKLMVEALLQGRKTQTRRIVKAPRGFSGGELHSAADVAAFDPARGEWEFGEVHQGPTAHVAWVKCPYGGAGDLLWVKETWALPELYDNAPKEEIASLLSDELRARTVTRYVAGRTAAEKPGGKLRPSIFMRRNSSRISLRIARVRVERLHDITESDAKAEGVIPFLYDPDGDVWTNGRHHTAYNYLWNEINGWNPDAWELNPWVWALDFEVLAR